MLIHLLLYWECSDHMLIHPLLYWEWRAHMLIHMLLYGSAGIICSFICRSIGSARLICSFICRSIENVGLMCSFICRSIGNGVLICTYSICCYVGEFLTFRSICFLLVVYVFSHAQGEAARTACATLCAERSDASTFAGEALPIVSVDSSDASGDDSLHQRIAELKEQS